ncbi:MAG TPA: sigma-70 family RNA polymerase sigma factor [Gemmataceae bacterium]|jgi:RNA polymerase sigma factor (sigma-70 family)|nr:sigma-70 family RNA polymerase sigma factor [Gemmataceae bacterium]
MADAELGVVLRHIRTLAGSRVLAEASDGQLLERFARCREDAAFALLLRRHGPMVLGVARRVLRQVQDAEDVFQATFLLLTRKAASIREHESVGSWLHGVAYRLAARARAQAARRLVHEKQAGTMRTTSPGFTAAWQELQAILDEALHKLSEKYRSALVLCYLEGKTQEEAARQLGCPLGTVRSRLAQGRKLLRARLARRGLALSAGALGTMVAAQGLAAEVSASLQTGTLKAGLQFAAGKPVVDVASVAVARLVKGGLHAMLGTKLKLLTAVLVAVAVATSAGVLGYPPPNSSTSSKSGGSPPAPATQPAEYIPVDLYRDISEQCGINFTYRNGEEADHYAILEALGGGIALIDYDSDGLLDIFITGGGSFEGQEIKGRGNRLYKNLGNGTFRDVTREVGLDQPLFYSHGCAVADYDCDGWPDLLVTGWGRMALYHNEPDGKGGRHFKEVTFKAGLPEGLWTTSAAWADLDGDGYPDLYVCQYVNWSFANHPLCSGYRTTIPRDICPPKSFTGLPHKLFRNNGDGTFTDVSKEAGLRPHTGDPSRDSQCGKGLGVVIADVDGDGKPDIYVANDTVDNFLYLNRSVPGKIRLQDAALASGVARDDRGVPNGSMGVDCGDYDGSGRPSLWVTNYENEMHALYRNQGRGVFLFSSPASGIAAIGQRFVGFGTGFLDVDNDGWPDIFIANGHVIRHPREAGRRQRPVLLRNRNGRFVDITPQGGPYFRTEHLGRGVAIGDLDNDGRPDLIISHINEPVAVLRNQADAGNHWLGIVLEGKKRRDVVGARIVVEIGDRRLTCFAKGGGSYLSSSDRRHLFGLGKVERIDRITVYWPPLDGEPAYEQQWNGERLRLDRYWRLQEGTPQPRQPGR